MAFGERQPKDSQPNEQEVRSSIQKAADLAARCRAAETSDNYEFLEEQIDQLESQARQAFQARLDLASLLSKLEAGKPLAPDDVQALELLIVGDAEYYLKYESELEEWKAQLNRVLDQIASLQPSALEIETLMQLRALCREAREVLADLVFYFDAKERTAKFRAATQGSIDAEGCLFLAQIIRGMLASANA